MRFLVPVLFCMALSGSPDAGESVESCRRYLPLVDTLDLYLQNVAVGSMSSVLKGTEKGYENEIRLTVEMPDQFGRRLQKISLYELRRYGGNGCLLFAAQEMTTPAGRNRWELSRKSSDSWLLTVVTAGVENSRSIKNVTERITTTCALYQGVISGDLTAGTSWDDTTFELTSGEMVAGKIRCTEVPSNKNNQSWVFSCSNNLVGRNEIWKIDRSGKTVYREVYPYTARRRNGKTRTASREDKLKADIFALVKISVDRPLKPDIERVQVRLLNSGDIDSSVKHLYVRKGEWWELKPLPGVCTKEARRSAVKKGNRFCGATPTLQAEHPRIIRLAAELFDSSLSVCELIEKYNSHVFRILENRSNATFSNAVETLNAGYGDCGEHAVLLAALLRASGIPARIVLGLLYVRGKKGYYYHAWVSAKAERWIFADPSHNRFPANTDRIPLVFDDDGTRIVSVAKNVGRTAVRHVSVR